MPMPHLNSKAKFTTAQIKGIDSRNTERIQFSKGSVLDLFHTNA